MTTKFERQILASIDTSKTEFTRKCIDEFQKKPVPTLISEKFYLGMHFFQQAETENDPELKTQYLNKAIKNYNYNAICKAILIELNKIKFNESKVNGWLSFLKKYFDALGYFADAKVELIKAKKSIDDKFSEFELKASCEQMLRSLLKGLRKMETDTSKIALENEKYNVESLKNEITEFIKENYNKDFTLSFEPKPSKRKLKTRENDQLRTIKKPYLKIY